VERSLARLIGDGPILVAREMCEVCHGEGKVPTPDLAAWEAKVERLKLDTQAEFRVPDQSAYERARKVAGPPPEPTSAECKGCNGRGFNETELTLSRLAELLPERSSPEQLAEGIAAWLKGEA
jgi:RecJ-like exonuclease